MFKTILFQNKVKLLVCVFMFSTTPPPHKTIFLVKLSFTVITVITGVMSG